ncbi:autotransporter-associated beta strand repeat-containing protein/T5SS/PEP-CTERM-associated repeat-containing protein, partial [Pseudoxanthobacter soli DSM 19599]
GTAGTVTIAGATNPQVVGMDFMTDGYTVTGQGITLAAFAAGLTPAIMVDSGTATIASVLAGTAGLEKTGAGTLILSGTNTYTGGTTVSAGTLQLSGGGSMSGGAITIAGASGETAKIVVTGTGTAWNRDYDTIRVGDAGTGTLEVTAAGKVTGGGSVEVGSQAGSIGTLTVSGSGSQMNAGSFTVGRYGSGSLTVSDGGLVTSGSGYLGSEAGSTGTATVTGSGSIWNLGNSSLNVGRSGSGTLLVSAGGVVTSGTGYIADNSGSTGSATVTGSGSHWNLGTNSLYVGDSALSASLTISAGGRVTSGSSELASDNGDLGSVTVTGAGSTWTLGTATLTVGYSGLGTLLVEDGASLITGTGRIGYSSGAVATATVTGADSSWAAEALYVGDSGTGTLTIADGGVVTADSAEMGRYSATGNGTIVVTGTGSRLDLGTGTLTVANIGSGTLSVGDGGVVVAGQIVKVSGATGAAVTLDEGVLRASASQSDYLSGFSAGDVTLATGGGTIDTNGFDIAVASEISGIGSLTKAGAGTLTFTADNSYTGVTTVSSGTLR